MYPQSCKIKRRWTVQEINLLMDMTKRRIPRREICLALGRQYEAVRTQQKSLQKGLVPSILKKPEIREKWDIPKPGSIYQQAILILGRRHRYDDRYGNLVDNKPVNVRQLLAMAGFKMGE